MAPTPLRSGAAFAAGDECRYVVVVAAPDHPSRRVAVVLHEPLLGGAATSLLRMLGGLERRLRVAS